VFDECVVEGKILFLHRLASRGAAYYLKLIHELFDMSEEQLWNMVREKRDERRSEEARERYKERLGREASDKVWYHKRLQENPYAILLKPFICGYHSRLSLSAVAIMNRSAGS